MFGLIILVLFFYIFIQAVKFEFNMIFGFAEKRYKNPDEERIRRREQKSDNNLIRIGIAVLLMFIFTWIYIA